MGRRRSVIEAGIQAEADDTFVVRPFSFFRSTYALPNQTAKEFYVIKRVVIERIIDLFVLTYVIIFAFLYIFGRNILRSIASVIPIEIMYILTPILIFLLLMTKDIFVFRVLRSAGAQRIPRTRWRATNPGNPFSSVESAQLGGLFLILTGLTALLAAILLASYLGPPGRDAGMPYLFVLFVLAACASLALATWHELWRRDRRKGASKP